MTVIKTKLWSEDFAALFSDEPVHDTDTIETYTLNPFNGKYERAGVTGGFFYNNHIVPMVHSIGEDSLRQYARERRRFFEEQGLHGPYISTSAKQDPFSETLTKPRGKDWIPLVGFATYWHRLGQIEDEDFKTTFRDYLNALFFGVYHMVFAVPLISGITEGAKKIFS